MLERTRKPRTDSVELRFLVPAARVDMVRKAVAGLIEEEVSSVPWREALGVNDAELPGQCIRGGRVKEGLTQGQLSTLIGVPQRHISEMENGKRPISKAMAKRLGEALKVGYKVFL